MKTMLFVVIFLGLWACNEPIIPPIDTTPKPWQPEIVWRKQHGPTKFDQLAYRVELYENKLIAGYQAETGSGYWIYDKNTGEEMCIRDSLWGNPCRPCVRGVRQHIPAHVSDAPDKACLLYTSRCV